MSEKHDISDVKFGRDPLTGIYNFQMFTEKVSNMLHENADKKYVLIIWDIERFKVINDLFGMETANKVLIEVGESLTKQTEANGICGRIGGDIFAISFESRYLDFEELVKKMNANFKALHVDYKVVSQAGIYFIDDINIPVYQMCDRAKLALNTIKGIFDKRYAVYDDDMRIDLLEEQEIIMDLERGLSEHQFYVEIQPIYELNFDTIVSGEALVRWNHPVKGVLSPGKFIPIFERNGMVTRLDAYVWEETCRLLQNMKQQNMKIVPVSVNVSRLNLFRENLCDEIMELIHKYGLDTSMLRLEITESAYVESPEQLNQAIDRLQKNGFKILMDDFGSGYSSLNMLKDLSFDILKVDMRFIDDLDTSQRAANVVTSVVRMAKWLGMVVVAEGVEKRSQAAFLKSIGCDRVQGYYFSKPLSEMHFAQLVDKEEPYTDSGVMEELDIDNLLDSTNLDKRTFLKELVGAMVLCEVNGSEIRMIRVNDSFYQLFETTHQQLYEKNRINDQYLGEEPEKVLECCHRAFQSKVIEQMKICMVAEDKNDMWLHLKIKYIGINQGKKAFYINFSDITQYHKMEKELKKKSYSELLYQIYQEILELDYTNQRLTTVYRNGVNVRVSMENMQLYKGLRYFAEVHVCDIDRERFLHAFSENKVAEFYKSNEIQRIFRVHVKSIDGDIAEIEITVFKIENESGSQILLVCSRRLENETAAGRNTTE